MVKSQYRRRPDEDEAAYVFRICGQKDAIGTWKEVAGILNEELGNEYDESKYRKQYQSFQTMFDANREQFEGGAAIDEQIRELHRERMKLQTEKLEYNRWLREHARDELIEEHIIEAIKDLPAMDVPAKLPDECFTDDGHDLTGIVCYADEHYGAELEIRGLHGEILNKYDPEVFADRMETLLSTVTKKARRLGMRKLRVYSFGDETDGILRVSQLMKLRYGVVDAALLYAEYMANWLNRLASEFVVDFQMTSGNHTELRMLGQPKGTFTKDNMSKIIRHIIKIRLENNPNFVMTENPTGLIWDKIGGKSVLGFHGESKDLPNALREFSAMYDTNVDILIGGHQHHYQGENVGIGKDTIIVPSIIGVDDYSMSLHKTSDPGAMFLVVQDGLGVVEQHNIKFVV